MRGRKIENQNVSRKNKEKRCACVISVQLYVLTYSDNFLKGLYILGFNETGPLPFATTAEIDNLIFFHIPLAISSRTTGAKNTNCGIIATELHASAALYSEKCLPKDKQYASQKIEFYDPNFDFWRGGQRKIVYYNDLVKFEYADGSSGVSIGGDSGSAVIAETLGGVRKIVGLVFLGEASAGTYGYFCRIDKIASILNVSEWNGNVKFSDPSTWQYITKPVISPDPENSPTDLPLTIIEGGKKYWRIGTAVSPLTATTTTATPTATTTTATPTATTTTATPTATTTNAPAPIVIGANKANWGTVAIWGKPTNTQPAGFAGGYDMTTVGTNGGTSAYGTYDQTGNVFEWNDFDGTGSQLYRGIRGGDYDSTLASRLAATTSYVNYSSLPGLKGWPPANGYTLGFRVASYGTMYSPVPDLTNMVMVGDINNAPDNTGYGSVDKIYWIGKYLVTNNEYCAFLNAVAKTDTYQLYNKYMSVSAHPIIRSGTNGNYIYTIRTKIINGVVASYGNKPVYRITWFNAARYCNWLHNKKPTGIQNASTTEDGAYTLNGQDLNASTIGRNPFAFYHIPTENEWYKAAYYKGGNTNAGYWEYATQSNTAPAKVPANNYGDGVI
jgi:formylglycine-generating enzyme required for sulfatase activity